MPTEIVIETDDRPGILAAVGELFGEIGVNIMAAAAFTHNGKGVLHFVVDEADRAKSALERSNFNVVRMDEVLAVSLDDKPGELGRYARRLADAGINITSFYTSGGEYGDREIVISVDNVEAAKGL